MLNEGSGHIQWLGKDKYRLVFYLGTKPDGTPDRRYTRGRGTPRQAELHRLRRARSLLRGAGKADTETVAGLLRRYYEDRQSEWRPSYRRFTSRILDCLSERLGRVPLSQLTPRHGTDFKAWALRGGGAHGRPLGAKTVREHLSFLLTALDFAVEEGDLEANPVRRKRLLPTAKPATVEWLEVDEIDVLLHAVGARLLPIVVVALDTGLRISELLGLRWRDVDLEAGLVSVQHQLQRIDGRWQWERLKTDASTRVVPLGVRAHAGLVALHRTASAEPGDATRLLSNWSVFSDGLGRPIPYNTVSKRLRRVTRGLGWTRRGFHTLRHTYVSHQLRAGTDAKRLAQFTGHNDAGFLLRRYAHALRTAGRLPSYFDEIAPSWLGEVVGHDS